MKVGSGGDGHNWIVESHLYACFLVNQNIPLLKSLRDSWGVGEWGSWQYKSFKFYSIAYWLKYPMVREGSTQKMTSLTWGVGG